jgi:phosphate transport system substrate-binding protein
MRGLPALILLSVLIVGVGCGRSRGKALSLVGSTSVQPFAEMLAEEYQRARPNEAVEVQGGGSTAGIQAVANGVAEVGMCSRRLKPAESEFTPITIARDGIAMVAHRSNPVQALTREQVRDLFSGMAKNWKEVGGPDRTVRLITREEGSGTREAFTTLVMGKTRIANTALTQESNGAVKELVRHDPCAIGYMSLGLVGEDLKALAVDGVAPSTATVVSGKYPLVRPFLFVLKGRPTEAAQRFIEYVLSAEAQGLLEREGLVRAR